MHSLPLFVRLEGRPVILIGDGESAAAKRRLLARAGAEPVGEAADAALAIVALEDDAEAETAVVRLRARGILVNAVDRPALCDFTLPAIVERGPVIVAIGTGGAMAGLAAALRQQLEALLPAGLGALALALSGARARLRERWPDGGARRRAIQAALAPGGALDPLAGRHDVEAWLTAPDAASAPACETILLASPDPDMLTLRAARLLGRADRIVHDSDVPPAILARARADAERLSVRPASTLPGLTLIVEMARP